MALFPFDFSTALITCVIFLATYFIVHHYWVPRSYLNLPPGPTGFPILGNLPSLDPKAPYISLNKLANKYGPVFSLRFGSFPVVVLSSFESVKEAFIKNGDDYDDRPHLAIFDLYVKGKGRYKNELNFWNWDLDVHLMEPWGGPWGLLSGKVGTGMCGPDRVLFQARRFTNGPFFIWKVVKI